MPVTCAEELQSLISRAEGELHQRELAQTRAIADEGARRARAEANLRITMANAKDDACPAHVVQLTVALENASKEGVTPKLRVEARHQLDRIAFQEPRGERREQTLERLQSRLADAAGVGTLAGVSMSSQSTALGSGSSREDSLGSDSRDALAQRRKQVESLLAQLRLEAEGAAREGASPESVARARELMHRVERDLRKDKDVATKIRSLAHESDAEKIEAVLENCTAGGFESQRLLVQLEERKAQLTQHKKHQDWLHTELDLAASRLDAMRLAQLSDQARALGLTVPADMVALMDELEAPPPVRAAVSSAKPADWHLARLQEEGRKKVEAALTAIDAARGNPTLETLEEAQGLVLILSQSRAPSKEVRAAEGQLAELQRLHEPRLKVEEELQFLFSRGQGPGWHTLLLDGVLVERLRGALVKAAKAGADQGLVELCRALLNRSVEAESSRRSVVLRLESALNSVAQGQRDLSELEEAVEVAKRYGIETLAAEREAERRRRAQVTMAAAEAELREAAKGTGADGLVRLQQALKSAKDAGVAANSLRRAQARVEELRVHAEKCELVAGNIRRALPTLDKEPWHLETLVKAALPLEPWTPELEKHVRLAREKVAQAEASQGKLKWLEGEIRSYLTGTSPSASSSGGPSSGQTKPTDERKLADLVENGKRLGVNRALLQQASERLRLLRLQTRQLSVAERKLQLAVAQKDLPAIERGVRAVRTMGAAAGPEGPAAGGAGAGAVGATPRGGDRGGDQPHSERLLEAATTIMRHMGDAQARRQAAQMALQERMSDTARVAGTRADPASTSTSLAGGRPDSQGRDVRSWMKQAKEAIHEAKQSGVAPTLIEHARLRVRQVQRHEQARQEACAGLRQSLGQKGVPTQEIFRNLRRVQRLQEGPHTAR